MCTCRTAILARCGGFHLSTRAGFQEFEASQGYIARPYLSQNNISENGNSMLFSSIPVLENQHSYLVLEISFLSAGERTQDIHTFCHKAVLPAPKPSSSS